MFGEKEPMDKPAKEELANSIIGKEKASGVVEDTESDNEPSAPSSQIQKMTIEMAHGGHLITHHYMPPKPSSTNEPSKPSESPRTHVVKSDEVASHVQKHLGRMAPAASHGY